MFGRLISLFVLITIVYQVITLIINQANAKKERERARELSRQKGGQARPTERDRQSDASSAQTRESAASAPGRQSRLDDLAARRQQQLEELRRRARGASSGAQVRTGTGAPRQGRTPTLGPGSTPRQSSQAGPGNVAARIEQDAAARRERKKREYDRQVRAQQARQREQEEALTVQRASDQRAALAASAAAQRVQDEEAARQLAAPDATLSSLTRALRDRRSLRQAIILNELLNPPLSLRDPGT